jgi:glutaredoxin
MGMIISFIILYGVYLLINQKQPLGNLVNITPKKTDEVILYWGEGCSHCKKVEEYLKSHQQIEKKIKIERKEVYYNKANSADLQDKAIVCRYDSSKGIPVPFLYFKGECVVGDEPIINFLNKKTI